MNETFGSRERIKKANDFSKLYKKGKRYRGKYLVLIYLANSLHHSRMSAVVSKRHGKAVQRNRIKRRIRTLYRRNKDLIKSHMDILIIPRLEIKNARWEALKLDYIQGIQAICSQT